MSAHSLQWNCRMDKRKPKVKTAQRIAYANNLIPRKSSPGTRPEAGQSRGRERVSPAGERAAATREGAAPAEAAHSRAYVVLKEAVLAGKFRPGEAVTLRSL